MNDSPTNKLAQIRWLLAFFMAGLVISGLTAIPLLSELDAIITATEADNLIANDMPANGPAWAQWLARVRDALQETADGHPFMFYGTDWLAFGHVVIAISFIGAWRDPVRNIWLINFGLIACALIIPWALAFGHVRGIPYWWRLIDCSFGIVGAVPLLVCKKLINELATNSNSTSSNRLASATA